MKVKRNEQLYIFKYGIYVFLLGYHYNFILEMIFRDWRYLFFSRITLIPISQVFFFLSVSKRKGVKNKGREIKSVFGSVVAGAFQITFRVKMYVNDFFLFFKNYFWYQHIKTIQNIQIIFNINKKKFKIFENAAGAALPNIVQE